MPGASAFLAGPTSAFTFALRRWRLVPRGANAIAALVIGALKTFALVLFLIGVRLSDL